MRDRLETQTNEVLLENANYKTDMKYSLQLCQWVLKPIGIWSLIYHRSTRLEEIISLVMGVICFSTMFFILIPTAYYPIFVVDDLDIKMKLFGPVGFCATSTIKYCYFGIRSSMFRSCVRQMERDWRILNDQDYRTLMMKNVAMGRNLTTLSAVFLYSGNTLYCVIAYFSKAALVGENNTARPLIHSGHEVFFNTDVSPTYEFVLFMQCFYVMIASGITTGACSLAATFVTHACGQIQVQMARLEFIIEKRKRNGVWVDDSLGAIVRDHVNTLRFSKDVEEVMREICLLEIVASTLIICLLEYYCIMEWANSDRMAILTYMILLISFVFNVLIFCYVGELLVDQGARIGAASYEIAWYNLSGKEALDLILLMAISNFPPKLTAGKMVDLSLNTFGSVLKTSVAYLNLLRTVAEW